MRQIVIINALGFGLEVAAWVQLMPGYGNAFMIKGFLDDRAITHSPFPLLGPPLHYQLDEHDTLVIALAQPEAKQRWATHFMARGASFFSVIHPLNFIANTAHIGQGAIIAPMNTISEHAVIEPFVTVYGFCKVGHHVRIGQYSHLASHCSLDGGSSIAEGSDLPSFTKLLKGQQWPA